jgi:hypothetical protein
MKGGLSKFLELTFNVYQLYYLSEQKKTKEEAKEYTVRLEKFIFENAYKVMYS